MKYIKKWCVYSERSGNHIVSLCDDGNYACDCPGWKFHRVNCKHIRRVWDGDIEPLNMENWEGIKGKKQKVKKVLDMFQKIQEEERRAENYERNSR